MTEPLILSPTDFIAITNQVLDTSFGFVYLEGEISQFRISKQKWVYFDLKDEFSKVRCFASVYALPGPLEDGMVVRVGGSPKMHPQFGFSLNLQSIKPVGEGSLHQALALLKNKLQKEGIFSPERKRPISPIPNKIALITSAESAAYADFTKIAAARWPYVEIDVYDSLVQGENAPISLINNINLANAEQNLADVLVVIRGGGSADDLAAFNDERLVRAVASSRIPTFVAIGHEVDESLCELAADNRASTPSNAAELLLPDKKSEQSDLKAKAKHLAQNALSVAALEQSHIKLIKQRLQNAAFNILELNKSQLNYNKQLLASYNPENVLKRGYAMIKSNGQLITSKSAANKHQELDIIFKDGILKTRKLK